MYSHKVLVNNEGFVVEECVLLKDNVVQNIEVQEGQFLVNYYDKKYIKPKWDGSKWIEYATPEEIADAKKPTGTHRPSESEILYKELAEMKVLSIHREKLLQDTISKLDELQKQIGDKVVVK